MKVLCDMADILCMQGQLFVLTIEDCKLGTAPWAALRTTRHPC